MATGLIVFSIVSFLILVNALYVAAEFGAVSARRSRIQELANQRNWFAGLLLPVVQNAAALDRYVATCQIGITLSSLVLGAYGQATLAVMLARPLERERAQMALVVDEYGGTAGIVTLQDLFEKVVGKVDESGSAPADIYAGATDKAASTDATVPARTVTSFSSAMNPSRSTWNRYTPAATFRNVTLPSALAQDFAPPETHANAVALLTQA